MPFNGPAKEVEVEFSDDELVYCVQCGNTFVWARNRDCPTCTVAEMLEEADN